MTHHARKRIRVPAQNIDDNSSIITASSNSSTESSQTREEILIAQSTAALQAFAQSVHNLSELKLHRPHIRAREQFKFVDPVLNTLKYLAIFLQHNSIFTDDPRLKNELSRFSLLTERFRDRKDIATSTDPTPVSTPAAPERSYASVASQADAPTPPPSASPSPSTPHIATTGSRPPGHSPKPHSLHTWKPAQPLVPPPKASPTLSKSERQVRLVACIANHPDAFTCDNPRWKAVPTDCFSTFSKDIQRLAPGCVPIGYRLNRKGNLIISFTPSTPRSLLMSNIWVVRGTFELATHVPLIFDTPWSTLHLANVPTRLNESSPTFDSLELITSLKTNPALCALPITSQPRWLRHSSNITGPRSSVVFSFEDPNGAIAQQLLKTPTFMFGQQVTVKPWINKPSINARAPRPAPAEPSSTAPRVSSDLAHMDI